MWHERNSCYSSLNNPNGISNQIKSIQNGNVIILSISPTCLIGKGSVCFTADFLAATDRLELLCHQSDAIRRKKSVCHAITVLLI